MLDMSTTTSDILLSIDPEKDEEGEASSENVVASKMKGVIQALNCAASSLVRIQYVNM